jgi:hypothetical protein
MIRYVATAASLRHRFADHPFDAIVWTAVGETIRGIAAHRPVRLRGVPALPCLPRADACRPS